MATQVEITPHTPHHNRWRSHPHYHTHTTTGGDLRHDGRQQQRRVPQRGQDPAERRAPKHRQVLQVLHPGAVPALPRTYARRMQQGRPPPPPPRCPASPSLRRTTFCLQLVHPCHRHGASSRYALQPRPLPSHALGIHADTLSPATAASSRRHTAYGGAVPSGSPAGQDNELVIVLEWAEAGDLANIIKERQAGGEALPTQQVWAMFHQVSHPGRGWGAGGGMGCLASSTGTGKTGWGGGHGAKGHEDVGAVCPACHLTHNSTPGCGSPAAQVAHANQAAAAPTHPKHASTISARAWPEHAAHATETARRPPPPAHRCAARSSTCTSGA